MPPFDLLRLWEVCPGESIHISFDRLLGHPLAKHFWECRGRSSDMTVIVYVIFLVVEWILRWTFL